METLSIARFWAAAAWADGELVASEAAALRRFVDAATDLDAPARQEAEAWLTQKPDVAFEEVERLPAEKKQELYRAIIQMVMIDGKVTDDELKFVTRLRDQLALDAATIATIESAATS